MKPSTKFWITAPLTLQMAFSITLATWSYVHILTQGYTMRARELRDQSRPPQKHREVIYGAKEKLFPENNTTPPLDSQGTKRVQGIVGALLYYAQAVDNKLLVGISTIRSQQASATQCTNEAID